MKEISRKRKIIFTVLKVDSIPCSLVGKKMTFNYRGERLSESWDLRWPMPWIEQEFRKVVLKYEMVSKEEVARVYNPEEPDQYVEVRIRSYIDMTVPELLGEAVQCYGGKEALISNTGSRRIKYNDLYRDSRRLAKGLISLGVKKNNNVAVWAVNSPEVVISQFGISNAGAVFVPLNAYEKQLRMQALLKQSNTHTLIMQVGAKGTENIELLYKICPELCEAEPGKLNSATFPNLKNVIVISGDEYPGTYGWSDVLSIGDSVENKILDERQNQIDIDDVVHIIYTSGSTGNPKGVMLSHGNIIENANSMACLMKLTEEDVMCVQAPLFHCFGSIACVMAGVISGTSMVMVNRFKTCIALSLIEREKCTILSGVPTLFISCMEQLKSEYYDISSLRTGIVAGASCSPKTVKKIKDIMGIENLILSYGLTEASPCVSAFRSTDESAVGTVGKPIPGVQVKISSDEDSYMSGESLVGEVFVKGYNIMKGYYNLPEETSKVINSDGWLRTGDLGCINEDGYLCIKGRKKDIVIRCGENISPSEIEDFMVTCPDISEAYAVGIPDVLKGEEIAAFIKLKENSKATDEDIRSCCRGKLATNKIPKYIIFVKEFPLSDTGKVLKKDLKKIAMETKKYKESQKIWTN